MDKTQFYIIILLLISMSALNTLSIDRMNQELKIIESNNYTLIEPLEIITQSNQPGSPALPILTEYFEISVDQEINRIDIILEDIIEYKLSKPLFPQQEAVPLCSVDNKRFSTCNPDIYQSENRFPDELLINFGSGYCGNKHIGYVSYYGCYYEPADNLLQVPAEFKIEIETREKLVDRLLPPGYAPDLIAAKVGLENGSSRTEPSYLLISPSLFITEYQPLLEWRFRQGLDVFSISTDQIQLTYEGIDLQEKIRNCILDYYINHQVAYVTLGADVLYIPDRKVFAFDCEFGSYDDENEIPSDMYYACLDGNWDANGNQIFGEENDETDYFPEVFVSRIPANTNTEVIDFINRLMDYEMGNCPEYNQAGGFSMELWEGSASELCQQYIYENYFPDYYQITFLFDEENNEPNVFSMLNQNQNIVQHTGHASKNTITLENGHINANNLDQLQNEYGGIFYSIGCWSAAIDYPSIGEKLQITPEKGQLGYIGNSRYGWGAPSAPGFGFSEFFQKEFFQNLFWSEIDLLAQANTLQKIPFIPYYDGISVYKWIAYELNALGDSYFRLNLNNPASLEADFYCDDDYLILQVKADDLPLENAVVSTDSIRFRTNINGEVNFPITNLGETLLIYKEKYKSLQINSQDIPNSIFLGNICGNEQENGYLQGEELTLNLSLINYSENSFDFTVEYQHDFSLIDINPGENPSHIEAFSSLDLAEIEVDIMSVDDSFQLQNDTVIYLKATIIHQENNQIITEKNIPISIKAPDLEIISLDFEQTALVPGAVIPFQFTVQNQGKAAAIGLTCNFLSESEYVEFQSDNFSLYLYLPAGETVELDNDLILSDLLPSEHIINLELETITSNQENSYAFLKYIQIPAGEIGFSEDFETEITWDHDEQWQRVDTFSHSGNYSFSCRPEAIGTYQASSPDYNFYPEQHINFWYKYKMPMYGEDGVYFILEYNEEVDTLLFLGAGGALDLTHRPIEAYIESDWDQFDLPISDLLLNTPENGTLISLQFLFKFAEEIPGFNQYAFMDEIGVFIDDLILTPNISETNIDDPVLYADVQLYPNPVLSGKNLLISLNLSTSKKTRIDIYNLKGQKVKSLFQGYTAVPNLNLYWDGRDKFGRQIGAGLYFLRMSNGNKEKIKKFVIMK